jgi:hypothetical protein
MERRRLIGESLFLPVRWLRIDHRVQIFEVWAAWEDRGRYWPRNQCKRFVALRGDKPLALIINDLQLHISLKRFLELPFAVWKMCGGIDFLSDLGREV